MKNKLTLLIAFGLLFDYCAIANVKLPALLSDHMVLQRNAKITIWGTADAGEPVSVKTEFIKKATSVIADENGNWKVELQTPAAGGPYQVIVKGKNTIILTDVYLGDVWLASGQSNMEMPLDSLNPGFRGALNFRQEIAQANYPLIRFFSELPAVARQPQSDTKTTWNICTPENSRKFSAVAYFFARNLHNNLKVPIGILSAVYGGTPVSSWMRAQDLSKFGDFYKKAQKLVDTAVHIDQAYPTVIYNAIIAPLSQYKIKGVVWYQGEGNVTSYKTYKNLFTSMVEGWRAEFQRPNLPFIYVQITPYDYLKSTSWYKGGDDNAAFLMEAQYQALDVLKNAWIVPASDVGEPGHIHPRRKQQIGDRLAASALSQVYGQKIETAIPTLESILVQADLAKVKLKNTGTGLVVKGTELDGFELAGADKKFYPARAVVNGSTIKVTAPEVSQPIAVRYCFKNISEVNLYNSYGIPARPFRSDNW
jgi:sialate O-acetylesterase